MQSPAIGVVVLNWNGLDDTLACLESLVATRPAATRIVVVDNASTDGSADALERWAAAAPEPRPLVIHSDRNRGYAGGNNLGLTQLARDPAITHVLLLNNDATAQPALFAELSGALQRRPDAGLMGMTIFEGEGRDQVWYAGGRLPNARAVTVHGTVVPDVEGPLPTEFVTGCGLLIARPVWEKIGPLPESYFLYFEDSEYSLRAAQAGFPVLYAPRAVLHHACGGTVRRLVPEPRKEFWYARARALFVRRNRRGIAFWRTLAYLAVARPARALIELLRGRPRYAWAGFRGTVAGLLAIEIDGHVGAPGVAQRGGDRVVVHE
jgi:GT2 family glycosyltransferase